MFRLMFTKLLLAMLVPWSICAKMRPYRHVGCFKDTSNRALSQSMGDVYATSRVEECAIKANEKGYQVFSLQVGYECYSGPDADKTYNMYGPSTNCGNTGLGGNWANDVYQFTDELLWPKGTFSLLNPSSGCPEDIAYNGWVLQDTVDNVENKRSAVLNIDGFVTNGYVTRSFCTKTRRTSPEWPKGKYCIYKEGNINSLKDGRIRMDNDQSSNKDTVAMFYSKAITKYRGSSYIYVNVYCQTDGDKSVPIDLPISHPFYLLPYGLTQCQQVKWMVATKEWIRYATGNYNTQRRWKTGAVPYIKAGTRTYKGVTMFYCLYTSCNKTLNETQGVFQSPGFPNKYPNGQLCSWKIPVPANHTVIVRFTNFFLDYLSINDTDVVELHRFSNGTFSLNTTYMGILEPFDLTSTSDVLFVFRSNAMNSSYGFHAEYRVFVPEILQCTTTQSTTTTGASRTAWETTTQKPTTVLQESNKSKHEANNSKATDTGTVILIVIPLICFILIVVVSIDIYCRFRSKCGAKYMQKSSRDDIDGSRIAENPTYDRSAGIQMSHLNSTTTVNTCIVDNDINPQNTEEGYERLSRISPKREVHEDYQELNRTSCPNTKGNSNLQDDDTGTFYHVLEEPTDGKEANEDQMYQTVEPNSCSNGLYTRNVLYDRVA